jgi:heme-degrading monooxygenase HmoA
MPSHKLIQIVAAESTPEKDAKFEKWYTQVHIPTLFQYEGVKQVNRYRRKGDDKQLSKYMTIYEFDTEEAMAAFPKSPAFAEAIKDYEANKDTVGFTPRWVGVYECTKVWER